MDFYIEQLQIHSLQEYREFMIPPPPPIPHFLTHLQNYNKKEILQAINYKSPV